MTQIILIFVAIAVSFGLMTALKSKGNDADEEPEAIQVPVDESASSAGESPSPTIDPFVPTTAAPQAATGGQTPSAQKSTEAKPADTSSEPAKPEKSTISAYREKSLKQIPKPSGPFLGRESEIRSLPGKLKSPGSVLGLSGCSGIGKTSLALHITQKVKSHYKDGRIYIDFKSGGKDSVNPMEIMARGIHALKPMEPIPWDKRQLHGLYHTAMREKRGILFLDNVDKVEQVKLLRPPKTWLLIFTSVSPISIQDAITIKLDPLNMHECQDLIATLSPKNATLCGELATLCRGLPMAMVLAGKFIETNTGVDPQEFIKRLGGAEDAGSDNENLESTFWATFKSVYQNLDDRDKTIFNKLLVFPTSFETNAQEFVCEDEDNESLGKLLLLGLVNHDASRNRYHLHDQIRKFLQDCSGGSDQALAGKRHASYYLTTLMSAREAYLKGGREAGEGLYQFDTEWNNIKTGQRWVKENYKNDEEVARLCNSYSESGADLLILRKPPAECIAWFEAALGAAKSLEDTDAQKIHLLNLGIQCNRDKKHAAALDYLDQANALCKQTRDRDREYQALKELAETCMILEKFDQAAEYLQQTLDVVRESRSGEGEEKLLVNLGRAFQKSGDIDNATKCYNEGFQVSQSKEDTRSQIKFLRLLGSVNLDQNNPEEAQEFLQQGLKIAQLTKDTIEELRLTELMADTFLHSQNAEKALEWFYLGLSKAEVKANLKNECIFLERLGDTYLNTLADKVKSAEYYNKLRNRAKEIGDLKLESRVQKIISDYIESDYEPTATVSPDEEKSDSIKDKAPLGQKKDGVLSRTQITALMQIQRRAGEFISQNDNSRINYFIQCVDEAVKQNNLDLSDPTLKKKFQDFADYLRKGNCLACAKVFQTHFDL